MPSLTNVSKIFFHQQKAKQLIVRPRCGLGNRLRVMASAIAFSQKHHLKLAHLWIKDSPLQSRKLWIDDKLGCNQCAFETLFQPIALCRPYPLKGETPETFRLLSELADDAEQNSFNVVDEITIDNVPLKKSHFKNVDAVLLLTSLDFYSSEKARSKIYKEYFTPLQAFKERIEEIPELSDGPWLCVHLREFIREAVNVEQWKWREMVSAIYHVTEKREFKHLIVFSDSEKSKQDFLKLKFNKLPVTFIDWKTDDYISKMFLDFLAMTKSAYIINSGLSSFPFEAAVFGDIPHFDVYYNRENYAGNSRKKFFARR